MAVRKHLAGCDRCRDFHDANVALDKRLRREAVAGAPYPASRHDEILRAVRNVEVPNRRLPEASAHTFARAALAAAVLLVALGVAILLGPSNEEIPTPAPDGAADISQLLAVPAAFTPDAIFARSLPALQKAVEEPMWQEVANLVKDARAAGDVLLASLPFNIDGSGRLNGSKKGNAPQSTETPAGAANGG